MIQVEIFTGICDLQPAINKWLSENVYDIVDIKQSVILGRFGDERTTISIFYKKPLLTDLPF